MEKIHENPCSIPDVANHLQDNKPIYISSWWFGTFGLFVPSYWECRHFSEGWRTCPSTMALHLAIVFHWFHHQSNRREEYLLVDISTGKLMFRRRTKGGHLAWSAPHGSFKIQRFQEDVNRVSLCLRSFHCTGYHLYVRDHVFIGDGQPLLTVYYNQLMVKIPIMVHHNHQ